MMRFNLLFIFLLLFTIIGFSATPISNCTNITSSDTYYLTTDLVSNGTCINISVSNVKLLGYNHTITGNGSENGIETIGSNVTIENITIKGFYNGIHIGSSVPIRRVINYVTLINNSRGIYLSGAERVLINNSKVYNSSNGIALASSTNYVNITNNEVYNCSHSGLSIANVNYIIIFNNTVHDNHDHLYYNTGGAYISRFNHVNISNNRFYGNSPYGFHLNNGYNDVFVYDNDIYNNSQAGIQIGNKPTDVRIIFNRIHDNGNGIQVSGNIYGINITSTYFYNNSGHGIYIYGHSANISIQNDTFEGNAGTGIYVYYSSAINISSIKVYNGGVGIGFNQSSNSTVYNVTAFNNTATGSYGILTYYSDNITILNNTIYNNTYGIGVQSYGNVTVRENNVYNSSQACFMFYQTSYTLIEFNNASSCQNGFSFSGAHHDYLLNNSVHNATHGVHLIQTSYSNISDIRVWNSSYCFYLDTNSRNNTVYNFTCENSSEGIHFAQNADYNLMKRGTIKDVNRGIESVGTRAGNIVDGVIFENFSEGARVDWIFTNLTIINSIFRNSNGKAAYIYGRGWLYIFDSNITNVTRGVETGMGDMRSAFLKNISMNIIDKGVYALSYRNNLVVLDSTFTTYGNGSNATGIYVAGGFTSDEKVIIANNTFYNLSGGIRGYSATSHLGKSSLIEGNRFFDIDVAFRAGLTNSIFRNIEVFNIMANNSEPTVKIGGGNFNSSNVTAYNVTVRDGYDGFGLMKVYNSSVFNITIYNISNEALTISYSYQSNISDISIENVSKVATILTSNGLNLSRLTILNSDKGADIINSSNSTINSWIMNNTPASITTINTSHTVFRNITIYNSTCSMNLSISSNLTVYNITSLLSPISICTDTLLDSLLHDVVLRHSTIGLQLNAENSNISNFDVYNSTTGINIINSNNLLLSSSLISNSTSALNVSSSNNSNITNITIRNTTEIALKILDSADNLFRFLDILVSTDAVNIDPSSNQIIENSTIVSSGVALTIDGSNNTVRSNYIESPLLAINISSGTNNSIYNNKVNATNPVEDHSAPNYFNVTPSTTSMNIIGGTVLAGNYWMNPSHNGFSETCPDLDADFICDNAYSFTLNADNAPLASRVVQYRPVNDSVVGNDVTFRWNVDNNGEAFNCTLYVNSSIYSVAENVSNYSVHLPDGNYTWYVECSINNTLWNATNWEFFEVIDPNLTLIALPSWNVTYPTETNVSCHSKNPYVTLYLYRNGTLVASGNGYVEEIANLSAGEYFYECNLSDFENYTNHSINNTLIVSKNTTTLNLTSLPSWNVTYPTETNVSCSSSNPVNLSLYRNGVLVATGIGYVEEISTFPAGTYNYTCNTTGNENYSAASVNNTLLVTESSPYLNLTILPSNVVTVGTETNASCTGPSQLVINLYRNGVLVASGNGYVEEIATLPVGTYNYTCNTTGNENYTANEVNDTLIVVNPPPPDKDLFINYSVICPSNITNITVTDDDGPVEDALVVLRNLDLNVIIDTDHTDSNGNVMFQFYLSGNYSIKASASHHNTKTITVVLELCNVSASNTTVNTTANNSSSGTGGYVEVNETNETVEPPSEQVPGINETLNPNLGSPHPPKKFEEGFMSEKFLTLCCIKTSFGKVCDFFGIVEIFGICWYWWLLLIIIVILIIIYLIMKKKKEYEENRKVISNQKQ